MEKNHDISYGFEGLRGPKSWRKINFKGIGTVRSSDNCLDILPLFLSNCGFFDNSFFKFDFENKIFRYKEQLCFILNLFCFN